MHQACKIRLYPTFKQRALLDQHLGCARWVYNWGLQEKISHYKQTKETLSTYSLINRLPLLKREEQTQWLGNVSALSLCDTLMRVEKAFIHFFRGHTKFPAFKKKRDRRDSYEVRQGNSIDSELKRIYLPKFKEGIRYRDNREIEGALKKVTILKSPNGRYYAGFLTERDVAPLALSTSAEETALGLDFGLKHLVITSEGEKIDNPLTLARYYRRFAILQRRMKRKKKGSKNRERMRVELANLYAKITATRAHHLHQITNRLVAKEGITTFCIEDLNVRKMRRAKGRIQWAIQDASWGLLRKLFAYKAAAVGKTVRVIGQFEPSSKTCSSCGVVNESLTLADREWTCQCGARHDRDINAAINIKKMAFAQDFVSNDGIPKDIRESTPVEQHAATNQECSVT